MADSASRPRDALPGIPYKYERVAQEMVWRTVLKSEEEYLRSRQENPPKAEEELGRLAGFEVIHRPTYTEVRKVYKPPPGSIPPGGVVSPSDWEIARMKPTGKIATLISAVTAEKQRQAGFQADQSGAQTPTPSTTERPAAPALRKTSSTPTLKDLIQLQQKSISHEALKFAYKYFSEEHMAQKEREDRTRGGPSAPIPRAGKAVVGADRTSKTKTASGGADLLAALGPDVPRTVSRGVQCAK